MNPHIKQNLIRLFSFAALAATTTLLPGCVDLSPLEKAVDKMYHPGPTDGANMFQNQQPGLPAGVNTIQVNGAKGTVYLPVFGASKENVPHYTVIVEPDAGLPYTVETGIENNKVIIETSISTPERTDPITHIFLKENSLNYKNSLFNNQKVMVNAQEVKKARAMANQAFEIIHAYTQSAKPDGFFTIGHSKEGHRLSGVKRDGKITTVEKNDKSVIVTSYLGLKDGKRNLPLTLDFDLSDRDVARLSTLTQSVQDHWVKKFGLQNFDQQELYGDVQAVVVAVLLDASDCENNNGIPLTIKEGIIQLGRESDHFFTKRTGRAPAIRIFKAENDQKDKESEGYASVVVEADELQGRKLKIIQSVVRTAWDDFDTKYGISNYILEASPIKPQPEARLAKIANING